MTQTIFDAWMTRGDVRQAPRSWKNAEGMLCMLEAGGCPPPGPDDEPPDHLITLSEIIIKSREHELRESPEERARKAEERRNFNLAEYCRVHDAKKAAHRAAWIKFKRLNDLDLPPAA